MGRRIQRLERLRRLNARVRAGRSKPKGSKRESSSPAAGKASTESAVKIQVQLQLEKSRNVLQPAATSKRHEELHARSAVKRALPRYARINMLAPGVTWGQVQRHLQETGHIFWRPSLKEKREAARRSAGLKPPDGKKIYYRDVHLPELLVFRPMGQSYTEDVEMFDEGALVFQQKASAFPAIALDPPRGAQVIDACAAPGSKTSQMAAMMCNEGQIFAFDRDGRRLKTMMTLMQQRHVTCVEPAEKDFLKISFKDAKYRNVTHFLLDPSCSSSGMTAQPLTKPAEMQQLAKNQKEVILHAMRFPSCQRIAYSTCSVHEQENEEVVQDVLSTKTGEDFELEEALPWWPRRGHPLFAGAERCVRSSWEDQTIGFFCALFVKNEILILSSSWARNRQVCR